MGGFGLGGFGGFGGLMNGLSNSMMYNTQQTINMNGHEQYEHYQQHEQRK